MDSQDIRQRTRDDTVQATTMDDAKKTGRMGSDKKTMMKRGLRSLAVAVFVPVLISFSALYFCGPGHGYRTPAKPFSFPPLWALHTTCLASSLFSGLSAWLVWAEGGFHRNPQALGLYLAQLLLGLTWEPIVLGWGAKWIGLLWSVGLIGSLVGCSRIFRMFNPAAGDLIKPCLAWAGLLALVNFKLLFV